jgi:4-amino-4-deoxy-L-arabinose transferase-like glycosyltransferase
MESTISWLEKGPARVVLGAAAGKLIFVFALMPVLVPYLRGYYGVEFADDYDLLAWMLAEGHGYRFWADTAPTLMREPGYPFFLSLLFEGFGRSLDAARVANLALSSVTAWLIWRFVQRLTDDSRAALFSVLIYVLHPGVFVAELRGGFEILFMLVLIGFLFTLQQAVTTRAASSYAVAGVLFGALILVRSSVILFPVFLVLVSLLAAEWRRNPGRLLLGLSIVVVLAGITISPWIGRNYLVSGVATPMSSVGATAAHTAQSICMNRTWALNNGELDVQSARERVRIARDMGLRFRDGGYYIYFFETRDELVFNSRLLEIVRSTYAAEPHYLLICPLANVLGFWVAGKNWTSTVINFVIQVPFLALAVFGVLKLIRRGHIGRFWVVAAFAAYLFLLHVPIHAQARYSVPLVPILAILAAVGLRPGVVAAARVPAGRAIATDT